MISGYGVMQSLPQPFNMIHPWRIDRLKNAPELRIFLQPALRFPTLVDNVVVHDERDGFRPLVRRLQML